MVEKEKNKEARSIAKKHGCKTLAECVILLERML